VPDTGGAGAHRGGLSIERDYTFLGDAVLSVRADRETILPYGIGAGRPGTPSANRLAASGSAERAMPSKFSQPVHAGDRFHHRTAGAGGFGDPLDRDAADVLRDVRNGILSGGRAREAYGVVIDAVTEALDEAATEAERAGRRAGRPATVSESGDPTPLEERLARGRS